MGLRGSSYRFVFLAVTLGAALPASAITFSATQDADAVTGGGMDNTNTGGSGWISENWSGATAIRSFIQFDVSSLSSGSVTNARLRLFHDFNSTNGVAYDVFRSTGSWSELVITGANQPSTAATLYASIVTDGATAVWREWNVTTLVQGWVNGTFTNFGMVVDRNPNTGAWPYFRSRNNTGGNTPELVVDVVPEPATALVLLAGLPILARRKRK